MNALVLAALLQAAAPDADERPQVSLSDFGGLLENNIFAPEAPPRPPVKVEVTPEKPAEPAGPKARAPVVTGFVFDASTGAYQVVVEDRNTISSLRRFSGPMFLKSGEEFLEYRVKAVTASRVSVVFEEETHELALGQSFPGGAVVAGGGSSSGSGAPSLPAVEIEDPGVQSILERLKKKNKRD